MNPRTNWFYQRCEGDCSARTFNAVHKTTGKEGIVFIHKNRIFWEHMILENLSELEIGDEVPYAEMQRRIYGGSYGVMMRYYAMDVQHLPSFVKGNL